MKPTIYDIAREAGVSIATVSKVINKTGRISEKTKEKVLAIMEQRDYRPSVVASALTGKKTFTIGLFIPDLANPFLADVARCIEDCAQRLGYSVVICNTEYNPEREKNYLSLLRDKRVDGFILTGGFQDELLVKKMLNEKVPLILLLQEMPSFMLNSVTVDDYLAGYMVTDYLLSLGHRRIAILTEKSRCGIKRWQGYQQALLDAGVEVPGELSRECRASQESGKQAADILLSLKNRPTAIFAYNDVLAVSVYEAARERQLRIPDELSVVGFDNTILSTCVQPAMTTVKQPLDEMCLRAVEMLITQIEGKADSSHRLVLMPELVVRQSTQPPVI